MVLLRWFTAGSLYTDRSVFTSSDPLSKELCITNTGYGMVAAMCEEVQHPEREVPKAMVLSVAAAGVTGVVFCRRSLELYFGPD